MYACFCIYDCKTFILGQIILCFTKTECVCAQRTGRAHVACDPCLRQRQSFSRMDVATETKICRLIPPIFLLLLRFKEVHAWVNAEHMLARAYLGDVVQADEGSDELTALPPPDGKAIMSYSEWTPCTLVETIPANEAGDMRLYTFATPADVVLVRALTCAEAGRECACAQRPGLPRACRSG